MRKKISDREPFMAWAFLLPALIFLAAVCIYPVAYNIVMGFQDMNMMNLRTKSYSFWDLNSILTFLKIPQACFLIPC